MLTRDFDFELPEASIAQEPAPRGQSRLFVLDAEGADRHRNVSDLPELLRAGDLVVFNDTKVIPARIFGRRVNHRRNSNGETASGEGAKIELLLVEKLSDLEWQALARPGRKTRPGDRIAFPNSAQNSAATLDEPELIADVLALEGDGLRRVRFSAPVEPYLETQGHVPLPPYIKREDGPQDRSRYQTIFARHPGAVAAPTAGLHFDDQGLAALAARGVETAWVTLHVGIGTFKPVTVELVHEHRMDEERYDVPVEAAAAIQRTRQRGGRVVAVGTTVVRTLESAARAGEGKIEAGSGRTSLFITPGYRFQAVDLLLTNFHLPRSTLLMMISAFAGRERVLAAYREAVESGYRFYSYGDAMLLRRQEAR